MGYAIIFLDPINNHSIWEVFGCKSGEKSCAQLNIFLFSIESLIKLQIASNFSIITNFSYAKQPVVRRAV